MPCDRIEHGRDRCRLHQRGRAAAEEDRRNGPPRHARRRCRDLGGVSAGKTRLVDRFAAHVAVEVAIGTFRKAERPMDVNAEFSFSLPRLPRLRGRVGEGASGSLDDHDLPAPAARSLSSDGASRRPVGAPTSPASGGGEGRHASASWRKARARCDRPMPRGGSACFSSLDISPKRSARGRRARISDRNQNPFRRAAARSSCR